MILKGLAMGVIVTVAAVALFFFLGTPSLRPMVTAPSGSVNLIQLPNGIALPQLQPVQQGNPSLMESEAVNSGLLGNSTNDTSNASTSTLSTDQSTSNSGSSSANLAESQAVMSCGGK
jgi:hypothetical protein